MSRRRATASVLYPSLPASSRAALWLLVASFLLQPVLTYLITPVVAHAANGEKILVCTLQGSKWVTVDLSGPGAEPASAGLPGAEHCQALKLFQAAGSGLTLTPPALPVLARYAVAQPAPRPVHRHHQPQLPPYTGRAPPASA